MYDQFISVPSDTPPPTRGSDTLAFLMRLAGIILIPVGLVVSMISSSSGLAFLMIVGGIALFVIGKIKDVKANKREANPEQRLTLRRLLSNPDFVVYANTVGEAKGVEASVRESLSSAAQALRESGTVPDQASYEL
jgi:hypothetical protein